MPRRSQLPDREAEICQRIREARERAGISRVALAEKLGCDSSKLASYEYARTPVPYGVASKIAELTGTNQAWLASGKGPREPFFLIAENLESNIPTKKPFSEMFDVVLAPRFAKRFAEIAEANSCSVEDLDSSPSYGLAYVAPIGTPPIEAYHHRLSRSSHERLNILLMMMTPALYLEFEEDFKVFCESYHRERRHLIKGPLGSEEEREGMRKRNFDFISAQLAKTSAIRDVVKVILFGSLGKEEPSKQKKGRKSAS